LHVVLFLHRSISIIRNLDNMQLQVCMAHIIRKAFQYIVKIMILNIIIIKIHYIVIDSHQLYASAVVRLWAFTRSDVKVYYLVFFFF